MWTHESTRSLDKAVAGEAHSSAGGRSKGAACEDACFVTWHQGLILLGHVSHQNPRGQGQGANQPQPHPQAVLIQWLPGPSSGSWRSPWGSGAQPSTGSPQQRAALGCFQGLRVNTKPLSHFFRCPILLALRGKGESLTLGRVVFANLWAVATHLCHCQAVEFSCW